jgi:hypothetical protein
VSNETFDDIDFVSPSEGRGVRAMCSELCDTTVTHTADGGATWQQKFEMEASNAPRLAFTTSSDGWMLFESDARRCCSYQVRAAISRVQHRSLARSRCSLSLTLPWVAPSRRAATRPDACQRWRVGRTQA